MFTDRVKLKLVAGKGGNGIVSWRREKYIPKGGPTGGDGGDGGSITLVADHQIHSLESMRNTKVIRGRNGMDGGANNRKGKNGADEVIKVPCGTLVKDSNTGEVLFDFTESGQEWQICQGGKGGKGNAQFVTPTNRAPTKCTRGTEGQTADVELELKLIADVGLVGFPNAGKSTLITTIAKVRVKVAPYPFTTLYPNLGFIEFDDFSRVLIADIPGIIEGAHHNKGLGFEFLRHIERTKVLIFLLDASGVDGRTPLEDFNVLRSELEQYHAEVLEKPYLVVLNKTDEEIAPEFVKEFREANVVPEDKIFEMSAILGEGVPLFVEAMRELAQQDGKRFV